MTNDPIIFLSYASEDRVRVQTFYDELKSSGLNVWMDKYSLKGGQNWDAEIRKALAKAAIIAVFLSTHCVNKRGYVQREIKIALDLADTKLADDVFVIPILLDADATIPDQLSHIHALTGTTTELINDLRASIYSQLEVLGATPAVDSSQPITWAIRDLEEAWEGLPGYETRVQFIELSSSKFPNVSEINDVIRGWLISALHAARRVKFEQHPRAFSFGQDRYQRTNTWDASFSEPVVTGATISVLYSVWWYGAGAAHPNQYFRSFCFSLDPLIYIETLEDIFENREAALRTIQESVRSYFLTKKDPSDETDYSKEWVTDGTADWHSFRSFRFTKDGIEIAFAPYEVASYADGAKFAVVPYLDLLDTMDKNFQHLLGIAYLKSRLSLESSEVA